MSRAPCNASKVSIVCYPDGIVPPPAAPMMPRPVATCGLPMTSGLRCNKMRFIGRSLQLAGLALLPLSMILELSGVLGATFGTRDMLVMLIFGAGIFYLGRIVEGYSRPA